MAAGQFKGPVNAPDFRGLIKQDQDLLDRIPQEQTARRAELQRSIDVRVDDLIAATDRSRSLREEAGAYQGNWRDVVLVLCVVLFAVIWWNVPRQDKLAADVHCADPVGGGDRRLRHARCDQEPEQDEAPPRPSPPSAVSSRGARPSFGVVDAPPVSRNPRRMHLGLTR